MNKAFWQIGKSSHPAIIIDRDNGFDIQIGNLGASLEITTRIVDSNGYLINYNAIPLGGSIYGCLGATPDEDGDFLHHVSPGIIYYALGSPIILALAKVLFERLEQPHPLYPDVWTLAYLGMNTDQVIHNLNLQVGEGIASNIAEEKKRSGFNLSPYIVGAVLINYPEPIREVFN